MFQQVQDEEDEQLSLLPGVQGSDTVSENDNGSTHSTGGKVGNFLTMPTFKEQRLVADDLGSEVRQFICLCTSSRCTC